MKKHVLHLISWIKLREILSHMKPWNKVKVQTECLSKMHVFYLQKCREKDEKTLKLSY